MAKRAAKHYREAAKRLHHRDGELEIDDNARVSHGADDGAYVQAWVWVPRAATWPGARTAKSTPAERSEQARRAAMARWYHKGHQHAPANVLLSQDDTPIFAVCSCKAMIERADCPTCDGLRVVKDLSECPDCQGSGLTGWYVIKPPPRRRLKPTRNPQHANPVRQRASDALAGHSQRDEEEGPRHPRRSGRPRHHLRRAR